MTSARLLFTAFVVAVSVFLGLFVFPEAAERLAPKTRVFLAFFAFGSVLFVVIWRDLNEAQADARAAVNYRQQTTPVRLIHYCHKCQVFVEADTRTRYLKKPAGRNVQIAVAVCRRCQAAARRNQSAA